MKTTPEHDKKMATMIFGKVYPMYLLKVEKKGRTEEELLKVIEWLTGYDVKMVKKLIREEVTFDEFFKRTTLHPNARLITGVICGYRVEEIENPLTQKVRYLDKIIDELAKGKTLDKIMRKDI